MKKIYKLQILFDAENDEVDHVKETIDEVGLRENDIEEMIMHELFDHEFLEFLIDNGYMGEA